MGSRETKDQTWGSTRNQARRGSHAAAWVQGKRNIKRAGGYADNTEPWGEGKDQEWGVVGKETQQRAKNIQRTKRTRRHHIGSQSHTEAGCSAATRRHHAQSDNALTNQMKVQRSQARERPHPHASDKPTSCWLTPPKRLPSAASLEGRACTSLRR